MQINVIHLPSRESRSFDISFIDKELIDFFRSRGITLELEASEAGFKQLKGTQSIWFSVSVPASDLTFKEALESLRDCWEKHAG